jgi:hypothetical protein
MGDLRPALDPAFEAFAVAATVTPLGGTAVVTSVIGSAPSMLMPEANADPSMADFRRRVAVRKSAVPDLPVGSTILAPAGFLFGNPLVLYTVDLTENLDPEVHHARVHE